MKRLSLLPLAVIVFLTVATAYRGAQIPQRGFGQRDVPPAGSRVEYKSFTSKILNHDIPYGLYLPPSYAASTSKRYPILYFLHGLNENEMRWSTRGETDLKLDKMIAAGRIGEFIVAIPFGANSFYTNFRDGSQRWEDMIVTEFIPMIESTYRANASRAQRGISGTSMGGYGALKIAFKNPLLFGSASAHSAVLLNDPNDAAGARAARTISMLGDPIFGLSKDLNYWNENNPLVLAKDAKRFNGLKIYFDCGTEDDFGFENGEKLLDDILTKQGYPHEAHLYPGNHGWDYAMQHTEQSLLFHWAAFSGK